MKTIQEVSADTLKIEGYLKDQTEGQFISYKDIWENTDVKMDNKGKAYMRRALKRLKIEFECMRGTGIRLASETSSVTIVVHRLSKIDNAVKRGEKTHKNLKVQFYERQDNDQKRFMDLIGYAFGAIRAGANYGKKILKAKAELGNFKQPELNM